MNDGLLKLEKHCRRRMNRLTALGVKGVATAKDKRKATELWVNREPRPGNFHKPGPVASCVVIRGA